MAKAKRVLSTPRRTAPIPSVSVPLQSSQPLRALTLFETLRPGHKTFRIFDDGSAPHLKEREYAVVDTTDREPQHGELFLIQYESGNRNRGIVQTRASICQMCDVGPRPVWWVRDLAGFRQVGGFSAGDIPEFAGMSDGPYDADERDLQSKLLGRIVGFATNSFAQAAAPQAGWEDEQNANAAFDPVEYLDVMIAAGYRPAVFRRGTVARDCMKCSPRETERPYLSI